MKAFLALTAVAILFYFHSNVKQTLLPALSGVAMIIFMGAVLLYLLWNNPHWLDGVPILGEIAGHMKTMPAFKSLGWKIALVSVVCWFFRGLEWFFLGKSVRANLPSSFSSPFTPFSPR